MRHRKGHNGRFESFVNRYLVEILGMAAILFFAISFFAPSYEFQLHREVRRVERFLHSRQKEVEQYAVKALQAPPDEWMDFPDLPEDMVIYKYNLDTLQSWAHEFPIGNDEVGLYPFSYRLQYLSNNNVFSSPLAYIGYSESFVNLGSDWYVIKKHVSASGHTKIVTGIRIKTEYPYGEISDVINPKLHLRNRFTAVGISEDDGAVVRGIEGAPLFSIMSANPQALDFWGTHLKWIALLFAVISLMLLHSDTRTWRSLLIAVCGLLLVRLATYLLAHGASSSAQFFSPILYADNNVFSSLGEFLLNNTLISLIVYALFLIRGDMFRLADRRGRRIVAGLSAAFLSAAVALYIHFALKSLVLNSNLVLEPFRINEISIYMVLSYFSFAMLFLALLDLLQMTVTFLFPQRGISLFSWRNIILYTLAISIFCVIDEGVHGLEKEYDRNRVNTAKLVAERDLPLEYHLRSVEKSIAADPFIGLLSTADGTDLIKSRLMDRYFNKGFIQKYNLSLALCASDNLLNLGTGSVPVPCLDFFSNQLDEYGVRLDDESSFYYISNFDDKTSYIGIFPFFDKMRNDVVHLFIEIESKYKQDPFSVFNIQNGGASNAGGRGLSSAHYSAGRLVSSEGGYNYPVVPSSEYEMGYTKTMRNGYVHFVNRLSDEEIAVVSRRMMPVFPYVVSLSYLMIFFGIFLLLSSRWARTGRLLNLPKHSLKRKITLLTTGSMVVALALMAAAVVSYTVKIRTEGNKGQMEDKIASVQTSLAPYCKYAMRYNALRTPQFLAGMEEVSRVTKTDVNIYDTNGMLICSTKPEIFSQFIVGKRMNSEAYHDIIHLNSQRHFSLDKIGKLAYYSIYAPLFNESGDLVAIANVPYISRTADINAATSSTVAMIINLYLVLLIAALIIGALLSNSLAKPILEIRDRMNRLTATEGEDRHVTYRNSGDELGVLIESYNKMVDDLDESARLLAQSEREQAWKEMARKIAHEIKNLLTPMRLSVQYMVMLKQQGAPGWEEKVSTISTSLLEQMDSLSDAADEFSSIAKLADEDAVTVDLEELMNEQVVILDNRTDVSIQCECLPLHPLVFAPRRRLARVFFNLINNAIQAIENDRGGGNVRVTIVDAVSDGQPAYRIRVEDDGPGVAEENLDKIFVPNFTTKNSGTGLGLVITKSIVEAAGGTIRYSRSEDMGGACFTVLLLAKVNVDGAAGEVEMAS